MTSASEDRGYIVIRTDREWFGDPRLGTFTASVDRRRVGKLPPEGHVEMCCVPGSHVVRIRQWWYRSPSVEVRVSPGESVLLMADIPRTGSAFIRFFRLLLTPSKALTLVVQES